MSYLAIFTQEKDGKFSVSVPALPGCFSQGNTLEKAKKNIEEAIELYLEEDDKEIIEAQIQLIMPIEIPLHRAHA